MGKMAKLMIGLAIVVMLLTVFFVYFLFFTPAGAAFILKKTVSVYFPSSFLKLETEGNLVDGVILQNVEFSDIQGFPLPNTFRIQDFHMKLDGFDMRKFAVHLQNARLSLPDSDPIVLSFDIADGKIKGNAHTRVLVSEDLSWLPITLPNRLQGEVRNLDIDFQGDLSGLAFVGSFDIIRIEKDDLIFRSSFCAFDLLLRESGVKTAGLYGQVVFREGTLSGKRTALIVLNEGKVIFEGDPVNPKFDIRASSQVEKVKMDITVSGYFHQPDMYLRSPAGLSQDRLLMMLATNQAWAQTEQGLVDQNLSPGVVKDFLDYFLSGYAQGSRLSWFFDWIRRVSIDYDQETGRMGIRTGLTDRLEAGYMLKQSQSAEQVDTYKLTGEYQITDHLSIKGEKEMRDRPSNNGQLFQAPPLPDDRIFFKIRQRF